MKDPKCRFIYVWSEHSRARLHITRALLLEILTWHQVMPDYLDFMFAFGQQSEPRDPHFSAFREHKYLKPQSTDLGPGQISFESIGKSERYYELCYNLKGVSQTSPDTDKNDWSIRQAAFYHQFHVVGGNSVWIVTKGRLDIQKRFKDFTGEHARPEDKSFHTPELCFQSSLSTHLLYCYWSTEDWRGYIKWLEVTVKTKVNSPVY